MSTTVFPFAIESIVEHPIGYFEETETDRSAKPRRELDTEEGFVVESAVLLFPQPETGKTPYDLWKFWRDHRRGVEYFLYKPQAPEHFYFEEDLGPGDDSKTVFQLETRFVDASTLKVYFDGVEQTSGWTLTDNNTARNDDGTGGTRLVFDSAVPSSVASVKPTGERYYPMRFDSPPVPEHLLGGPSRTVFGIRRLTVAMSTPRAGAHLTTVNA